MVVSRRILLTALVCAALGGAARAQAPGPGGEAHTGGRFIHASKCLITVGFAGDCDKDTAAPARRAEGAADPASDASTRHQFVHASRCVVSLGFLGNCDKDAPAANRRADAGRRDARGTDAGRTDAGRAPGPVAEAAPDTSTRHQFVHASKCVMSLGFARNCDSK